MAGPSKKKIRLSNAVDEDDERLDSFLQWCAKEDFQLNPKVYVGRQGSCAQYGMVAHEELEEGECLFKVDKTAALSTETTEIAHLLKKGEASLQSESGWVPQILALMYEYTNPKSRWRPYLQLVPDFSELDQPMFWTEDEIKKDLCNTGVPEASKSDLTKMKLEYTSLALPFIKKHSHIFSEEVHSFELYKRMVAFIMAYSFFEPVSDEDGQGDEGGKSSLPLMVPMADILNHIAKNNAHLEWDKDCLRMVTTRQVAAGEEVFNTFGQLANWQLLHMYGFAEVWPENIYDTVDIPMQVLFDEAKLAAGPADVQLVEEKWLFLEDQGVVSENGSFIAGMEGILTDEEVYESFKVLCMTEVEFREHQEKEGWSDSDSEEEEEERSLSYEKLSDLPEAWRRLLAAAARCCMRKYRNSLQENEQLLIKENWEKLSKRQQWSLLVCYGQQKLLNRIIISCLSEES
ncbi:N-lysine methyltransferase SETD6-like isoform X2 [Branchiostoma lanceolatum]|uniref:N-lysine methyltransferase SETD6-like isoform X2 n=1 Tax=Branchiostoma lanceolatum TaxID=7740 RepID=UPI0034511BD1